MTTTDAQGNLHDAKGLFAGKNLPEAANGLDRPASVVMPVSFNLEIGLDTSPLPPLPPEVGQPRDLEVTFGSETAYVYFAATFNDGENEVTVSVFEDEDGDQRDSISEDWGNGKFAEEHLNEEVVHWAHAVRARIAADVAAMQDQALKVAGKQLIGIALATEAHEAREIAFPTTGHAVERAIARGEKLAELGGSLADDPEAAIGDAITDLLHVADKNGLDIDDLIAQAIRRRDSEIEDPYLVG